MEKEPPIIFGAEKGEMMPEIEVQRITDGLGFGEGLVSHLDRKAEVGDEVLPTVEAFLTSNEVLVPIDTDKEGSMIDDDGCGDGRGVSKVVHKIKGIIPNFKSLIRPKMFGAAPTMTAATRIGSGMLKVLSFKMYFQKV